MMIVMAAAFTGQGRRTGERLEKIPSLHVRWREKEAALSEFTEEAFRRHLPVIFIGAAGIAVRSIAPLVRDKMTDSPVLVMDDRGRFIIPILSGHLGGANDLAAWIGAAVGAVPVITTSTDVNHRFAADVFAARNGLAVRNREGIRLVADKALSGQTITIRPGKEVVTAAGENLPEGVRIAQQEAVDILVSFSRPAEGTCLLWLSPKCMVIGVGCRRGKTFEELNAALLRHYTEEDIRLKVRAIATIDRKEDEEGLEMLAQYWHVPLLTFAAEELNSVSGQFHFAESEFVRRVTGTSNVCERAAVRGCMQNDPGTGEAGIRMILRRQAEDGITIAAAEGRPVIRTFDTGVTGS